MALVSLRQLLDHAADNGYGVPAFNVNNLEQVQAIMEAAHEVNAPVIMQASAGARKYAGEAFLKHLIQAAIESYPKLPIAMHQDHGQSPAVCEGAIGLGFSSVMMDGSLREDGKTVADYDYNWQVTKKVVDMAHAQGVSVEGELGCLGSLETMRGDKEDGHGAEITMTKEMLLTDPGSGCRLRRENAARCACDRDRHQPRRVQVHAQADRRHSRNRPHQGNPPPDSEHASGDARLIVGAARLAAGNSQAWRRHEGNVRRAGRRDPGSDQARRAQDQHRYRHPPGNDRRDPQVPARKPKPL